MFHDAGIHELVIAFNVVSNHTMASCEEYHDHGLAASCVDIGAPVALPLAKQAHLKLQDAQRAHEGEYHSSRDEHHLLMLYLDLFPVIAASFLPKRTSLESCAWRVNGRGLPGLRIA